MGQLEADISLQLRKLGLLEARIPPPVLRGRDRLAFRLGALLAVSFPFIYLALIPLAAWALYWFVSAGEGAWNAPIIPAAALLAGCALILSLLKPLVASPAEASEPHYLEPEKQPLLFALVRSLASQIGAPAPGRIAVDCNVNCCCVFAGGLSGLFRPGFGLTIGLPLAAGLRLDQFAGVVAHELAHAQQITAMRSSRIIWTVHSWLSRLACEQDGFDAMLQTRLPMAGPAKRSILQMIALLVPPGRRILWLLMILEAAATCRLRRRIEIAADRSQTLASGSDRFVSTILEINLLTVAAQRALVELSRIRRAGRLIDDYPGLIAHIRAQYPEDFVQRVWDGLQEQTSGMLSAHPCDLDRIALARAEQHGGIVRGGWPASAVFAEYQALCRQVTLEYYAQELGVAAESYELVPIQAVVNAWE